MRTLAFSIALLGAALWANAAPKGPELFSSASATWTRLDTVTGGGTSFGLPAGAAVTRIEGYTETLYGENTVFAGTGSAEATYGVLHARGELTLTNGQDPLINPAKIPYLYQAAGAAYFLDITVFTDPSMAPGVTVLGSQDMSFTISGTSSSSATDPIVTHSAGLDLVVSYLSNHGALGGSSFGQVLALPVAGVPGLYKTETPIPVAYTRDGDPATSSELTVQLFANAVVQNGTANIADPTRALLFDAAASADYDHTVVLDGFELYDDNSLLVPDAGVSAASGTSYAILPEPTTLAMLALGGMAMLRRRRRQA
jgi:hypothetical protein